MPIILSRKGGGSGGGGSSVNLQNASYSGEAVSVPDDPDDTTQLTWDELGAGVALLDLSNPAAPAVLSSGIYAVTAVVSTFVMTAGGSYLAVLHLDAGDQDAVSEMAQDYVSAGPIPSITSLSSTYYIPEGGTIVVTIALDDGASARDFNLREALIQRIS